MADEPQKPTGGTADQGGNAGETPTAGTGAQGVDAAAELEALRAEKQQWLAEKGNYEQAKRDLEETRQAPPVGYAPTPAEAAANELQQLRQRAYEGDAASAAALADLALQAVRDSYQRSRSEIAQLGQWDDVSADDRRSVRQTIAEAAKRGEAMSVATAARLVRLEKEARESKKAADDAAKKPAPAATSPVATAVAPVTATQAKNRITNEELLRMPYGSAEYKQAYERIKKGELVVKDE